MGKLIFLIFFADFCRILAIFTFLVHFHLHCGSVLGHFSIIFGIYWDFLGDPRDLFRRFWDNFGHF